MQQLPGPGDRARPNHGAPLSAPGEGSGVGVPALAILEKWVQEGSHLEMGSRTSLTAHTCLLGGHDHLASQGEKMCPTHPTSAILGVCGPLTEGCRAAPQLPSQPVRPQIQAPSGTWGFTRPSISLGPRGYSHRAVHDSPWLHGICRVLGAKNREGPLCPKQRPQWASSASPRSFVGKGSRRRGLRNAGWRPGFLKGGFPR